MYKLFFLRKRIQYLGQVSNLLITLNDDEISDENNYLLSTSFVPIYKTFLKTICIPTILLIRKLKSSSS